MILLISYFVVIIVRYVEMCKWEVTVGAYLQ